MSKLYKKKTELYSLTADYKRLDADGADYKFHGITIEKVTSPNFIARAFDNNKNIEDSLNNFIQCIKKKRGRHKSLFISLKISRAIEDLEKRTQLT